MSTYAILRAALLSLAALCLSLATGATVFGQDVGGDVGAGAGIFRAKNPEAKKPAKPAATGTKPANRPTTGTNRPKTSNVAERVEELLDKGNEARDGRRLSEAEGAYKEVLKLRPREARAAVAGAQRVVKRTGQRVEAIVHDRARLVGVLGEQRRVHPCLRVPEDVVVVTAGGQPDWARAPVHTGPHAGQQVELGRPNPALELRLAG